MAALIEDAIHALPAAWFKPRAAVYWPDLLVSSAIGWTALAFAVVTASWTRAALVVVAAFALYRALVFIHELTHLAAHELPGFRFAWNVVVGLPFLLPSFVYEGVHTDHHRQRTYGTPADPEYVPFGRRPPAIMAAYAFVSLFMPLALIVRFGVIAPLSPLIPSLRRFTIDHLSSLVVNHHYVRRAPVDRVARLEESAATATVWTAAWLLWTGVLPMAAFACWYAATTIASAINVTRTLASHRYDHEADEGTLSMTEQLLDSCTIDDRSGPIGAIAAAWHVLWEPVGLRFHALHHWIPSLPYHNLGRAHRLLQKTLAKDSPYGATQYSALTPILTDLVRRARAS